YPVDQAACRKGRGQPGQPVAGEGGGQRDRTAALAEDQEWERHQVEHVATGRDDLADDQEPEIHASEQEVCRAASTHPRCSVLNHARPQRLLPWPAAGSTDACRSTRSRYGRDTAA